MGTESKYSSCKQQIDDNAFCKKLLPSQISTTNEVNNSCHNGGGENYHSAELPPTTSTEDAAVPFVSVHVDENDVISGAKEILKIIRPNWNLNSVEFKLFTDGITNKLVGCFNNNNNDLSINGHNNHEMLQQTNGGAANNHHESDCSLGHHQECNSVVLVRVYGNKTDLLIDRKAETRNIKLLHSYGFAPTLFATFKNGLAYEYVPGVTLNTTTVKQPQIWRLVACRMAEMHKVTQSQPVDESGSKNGLQEPMLWKKTQSFFNLVPERFSDPDKQKRLEKTFLPISKMRAEFDALYKRLEALNSPMVFAHNDLLLGNVIYTESLQRITFIDYEYADYNYQAFDIGNHFAEFAGVEQVDYRRYPSKEFQLEWLRVYLRIYLETESVTDFQVEHLYIQVNQFALAAHFFWTIWSLIQAEHSKIDFDFVDYAYLRYNEYLTRKDEFLSLDLGKSS